MMSRFLKTEFFLNFFELSSKKLRPKQRKDSKNKEQKQQQGCNSFYRVYQRLQKILESFPVP